MADRIEVARKRAIAEDRLFKAVAAASARTGAPFRAPQVPKNRYPDLFAAQLVEGVADFIEQLNRKAAPVAAGARK